MNDEHDERLAAVFAKSLDVDIADVCDELSYQSIPRWDSVGHMALVAAIEEEFDIMIDTDDVIDMSSFGVAKAIVRKYL
jgi:acyl carrier protein